MRAILTQLSASEGCGKRRQSIQVLAVDVHVRMLKDEFDQLDVPLSNRLHNEQMARIGKNDSLSLR